MELDFPELASVLRQACANGLEVDHRVMARNLLCDSHRTPVERMRVFLEESGDVSTTKELQKALYQYRWRHVCPPRVRPGEPKVQPVYARAENGANAITQDVEMVATVLNLSWMGQIYAAARSDFKIPEFERFELANPEDVDEINQKLGDQLSEKNLREPFLAAILKARNRYERNLRNYIKITWVAEWKSLEKFLLRKNPSSWMQAVGVATETPVWVAVLCYPVRRTAKRIALYRPTQLDAGWYPHHFPSPPQSGVEKGGYSMFLGLKNETLHSYGLVREFIHEPVDFSIKDWSRAGELLDFVPGPVSGDLIEQRRAHLELLSTHYPDGVRSWMETVI